MLPRNYKHTLTGAQLRESAVKNPNAISGMSFVELFTDQYAAMDEKEQTLLGLKTCMNDALRNVKINHERYRPDEDIAKTKSSEEQPKKFEDLEIEEKIEKFSDFIISQLEIDPLLIDLSYSQNLMSLIIHPLAYSTTIGMEADKIYSPRGTDFDLYRDKTDNQIYYRVYVEGYNLLEGGKEEKTYIKGPVEVLYKLDPSGLFRLEYVKTDSDFIRDAFLGESALLPPQLQAIMTAFAVQQAVEKKKFEVLKEIEKQLLLPAKYGQTAEVKQLFFDTMTLVGQCQQNQITPNELVEKLKEKRHSVKEKDSARSVIALQLLETAIEKAKELPGYQHKSMLRRLSTVVGIGGRRPSTIAAVEHKVAAPNAANDPTAEAEEPAPAVKMHVAGGGPPGKTGSA